MTAGFASGIARLGAGASTVLGCPLRPAVELDLTAGNPALARLDLADTAAFSAYIDRLLEREGAVVGVGRWGEDRTVYRFSALFAGDGEARTVHLGIDLFAPAGTAVRAPLPGVVHSLADNARIGDYGPTVILEHEAEGTRFWTLYGHLDPEVLDQLEPGRAFAAGEPFAALGGWPANGGWPPHLHLQVITELGEHRGDFPGVAAPSEAAAWLARCPDPSPLLGLGELRVVR